MRKFGIIFAFLLGTSFVMQAQNYWIQCDSVKGPPKSVASAFVLNGEGYVVAGLEATGFGRKMYSYNVMQNDWDDEQSIGGLNGGGLSRGSASSFSIFEKGYICLGQGDNTNFLNDVWEYDPLLDVWSQKADYLGSARRGAVAFVIDNTAYVGTGEDATGLRKDFFKYDPLTNVWGSIADFGGSARRHAVGFAMGNQGYVGTGDDGILRNDFWQYQVFQNVWVQKANMPGAARSGATGWGIFPSGCIATGEDINWNYCNDVWEYNYFTNGWTLRAQLPASGRKHAISFVIGNIAYLGAGYNGNLLDDFYSYTGVVGMEESSSRDIYALYPNPATSNFSIKRNTLMFESERLQIFSADGRDIADKFSIEADASGYRLHADDNISGVYWYLITSISGDVLACDSFILN